MDVCTLIVVTTMHTIACVPPQVCGPSHDGLRILCRPDWTAVTSCNRPPPPTYDCTRPDGTKYTRIEGTR